MKGIGYFKAEPSEFARMTVGGKVKGMGKGISGFYLPHRTSIELVDATTIEQPFAFQEVSKDKQELTLQGGFLYRVSDPEKVLDAYNFSVNPRTKRYLSEDRTKLPEHILQIARTGARRIIQGTNLEALLVMSDSLSQQVTDELVADRIITDLGVEVRTLYFTAPEPDPDIARALGAQYRESLLQQADAAAYERRAQAVAQEKAIQENELTNAIGIERMREELVALEGDNMLAKAKYEATSARLGLEIFDSLGADKVQALALYELGKNADRIENLTVTPELLAAVKQGRVA